METISITIDIPDSFIKDCEAYNVSPTQILQAFIMKLTTLCTIITGNNKLLIAQTTQVFMDYLDTTIIIPFESDKKIAVCKRLTQTIIAMTITGKASWSEKKYNQLIHTTCKALMEINKSN